MLKLAANSIKWKENGKQIEQLMQRPRWTYMRQLHWTCCWHSWTAHVNCTTNHLTLAESSTLDCRYVAVRRKMNSCWHSSCAARDVALVPDDVAENHRSAILRLLSVLDDRFAFYWQHSNCCRSKIGHSNRCQSNDFAENRTLTNWSIAGPILLSNWRNHWTMSMRPVESPSVEYF